MEGGLSKNISFVLVKVQLCKCVWTLFDTPFAVTSVLRQIPQLAAASNGSCRPHKQLLLACWLYPLMLACWLLLSPDRLLLCACCISSGCSCAMFLSQLVSYNPNERPTAGEALLHRWFEQMPVVAGMATPSGTGSVLVTSSVAAATAVRSLSNSVGSTVGTVGKRVTDALPTGVLKFVDFLCASTAFETVSI
jgi:hypothetical protein